MGHEACDIDNGDSEEDALESFKVFKPILSGVVVDGELEQQMLEKIHSCIDQPEEEEE